MMLNLRIKLLLGSHLGQFYLAVSIPDILVIQVTLVILGFLVTLASHPSHPSHPSDSSQAP